jgi:oligosaccharide repeat unit polymerase
MATALLVLGVTIALALLYSSVGLLHPATIVCGVWTAVAVAHLFNPLRLADVNVTTATVVLSGLFTFAAPTMVVGRQAVKQRAYGIRSARLALIVSTILLMLLVVGWVSFRQHISSVAGTSFAQLDLRTVRAIQTSEAGRGGGLSVLMYSIGPVVACLGLWMTHYYSRAFVSLTAVSFYLVAQSPARTSTGTVLITSVVFAAYLFGNQQRQPVRRLAKDQRRNIAIAVIVASLAALAYFNAVGQRLQKTDFTTQFADSAVPRQLIDPLIYQIGGLSAFSVALESDMNPGVGERGRSLYLAYRFGDALGLSRAPNTIAESVSIPVNFNVYTAFGDLYFDFGLIGVLIVMLITGICTVVLHRHAQSGSAAWRFGAAIVTSVMITSPVSFRLLYLDTVVQLALGCAAFSLLERRLRVTEVKGASTTSNHLDVGQLRPGRMPVRHDSPNSN